MTVVKAFIGEPWDIDVDALHVRRTGSYVNSLSLLYAVYEYTQDAAGNAKRGSALGVTGSSGSLTYTPASDGDYTGQILPTTELTAALVSGRRYIVRVYNGLLGATAVDRDLVVMACSRNET